VNKPFKDAALDAIMADVARANKRADACKLMDIESSICCAAKSMLNKAVDKRDAKAVTHLVVGCRESSAALDEALASYLDTFKLGASK